MPSRIIRLIVLLSIFGVLISGLIMVWHMTDDLKQEPWHSKLVG